MAMRPPTIARHSFNAGLILVGILLLTLAWEPICKLTFAWEMETLTVRQKWNPPVFRGNKTPISLVNVDSRTLGNPVIHHLFQNGFTRPAAGYAVRFFNRARPQMVMFDASFNGGTHDDDLEGDQLFADSIHSHPPVASALIFEDETHPVSLKPETLRVLQRNALQVSGLQHFPLYILEFKHNNLNAPYPKLLQSPMHFFAANSSVFKTNLDKTDEDVTGYSRRWTPFVVYNGAFYPSLSLGALLNGHNKLTISSQGRLSWPGSHLDLGGDGIPLIKWYGHGVNVQRPVYPEYPFSDVVLSEIVLECRENPKLPICRQPGLPANPLLLPELFKNRYVLTGFTFTNSNDEHVTIYGSKYPGVYIVANTLDNAINNDFVQPAPLWLNLMFTLCLPLIMSAIAFRFQSLAISALSLLSLGLMHFMICLHAYQQWNLWVFCIYPLLSLLGCFTGLYIYRYSKESKRRQQMHYAFGKYVSPAVLEIIEKHPDQIVLGGERREMTFLFSDIRGFTPFADQNSPEVVQQVLIQYFSTMNGIIMHDHQGSINKLIGDAIMAYWGFPIRGEDHAFRAVSAALAMQEALALWRQDDARHPFHIGVGLHTGEAMVGNIGSEDFMDFTVIGDAVNIASRLEGLTKMYSSKIIISAFTYEKVKDRITARYLGWADLKGKVDKIEIYEPLGFVNL